MFVAELAVATVFYYICLRFCAQLMPSGKSRVWLWVSVVLLVGLIATLNLMDMYGIAIMPAVWVLLALGMRLSTGMITLQSVCLSGMITTIAYGMRGIVSSLVAIILYLLEPDLVQGPLDESTRAVIVYTATLALLMLLCRRVFPRDNIAKLLHNQSALVTLLIYEASVCVNLLVLIQGSWAASSVMWYFGIILGGTLLAVGMLLYLTYYVIDSSELNTYRLYNSMLEDQYALQLRHYHTYERYVNRLREYKHDHTALLTSVADLIREQQPDKALSLLADMNQTMSTESVGLKRYTTDVVFDATIQNLTEFCEEEGIQLALDISSPSGVPLGQMDAIRVLYNALKNAAEACLKLPRDLRRIAVVTHADSDWYYLEVTNAFDGRIRLNDQSLATTKEDRDNHGLGLKIVRDTVEKAGGLVTYATDPEKASFTLQVMIPMQRPTMVHATVKGKSFHRRQRSQIGRQD